MTDIVNKYQVSPFPLYPSILAPRRSKPNLTRRGATWRGSDGLDKVLRQSAEGRSARGVNGMDEAQTQIVTSASNTGFVLEQLAHCLELIEGPDAGHRFIVNTPGVTIGRTSPADIVLADSEVS